LRKVNESLLEAVSSELLKLASIEMVPSWVKVIRDAYERERDEGARTRLKMMVESIRIAAEERRPLCQDTGVPFYFVRLGGESELNADIATALARGTKRATKETPLRENVVHPLTSENPGTNVGWGIPYLFYDYRPNVDYTEITAVPRGGGADLPQTTVRIPSTGARLEHIKKGILQVALESRWACPPHVYGICIGGGVGIANNVALRAVFRLPTGARHNDPVAASLESEMLKAINELGIGPMALGGDTTALAVHIEIVGAHTAVPALVIAPSCWTSGRFASARIYNDGRAEVVTHPDAEIRVA
jgi:fumarate hydratase subunit alpha